MLLFFFFNDTATTEIYTLSLHDALPISFWSLPTVGDKGDLGAWAPVQDAKKTAITLPEARAGRSEEHTSELQSHSDLVCRLLLEKKKKMKGVEPQVNIML